MVQKIILSLLILAILICPACNAEIIWSDEVESTFKQTLDEGKNAEKNIQWSDEVISELQFQEDMQEQIIEKSDKRYSNLVLMNIIYIAIIALVIILVYYFFIKKKLKRGKSRKKSKKEEIKKKKLKGRSKKNKH